MKPAIWLAAFALAGCATGPTYEEAAHSKLIATNYKAADHLLALTGDRLDPEAPILTATLVSLDNLNQSSRLGQLISEHLASRFAQQGMQVVEMKMRGKIFMEENQGALLLSREVRDIRDAHHAQAVIVGTYASAQHYVYVTVKVLNTNDEILAAHNYALPLDSNIASLLPYKDPR